jgi:hypothetical protein
VTEVMETVEAVEQRREFKVWAENLEYARELVEKVNRKARRYGLSEYELAVGEAQEQEIWRPTLFFEVDGTLEPTGQYRTFYMVELVGEMPQIEGWSFVASLDYSEEAGVITRPVPGVEVDLSGHRARAAECDYCGTKRERSATYVLRHQDGRTQQVGSTCIKPYMGLTVSGLAWLGGDPLGELRNMALLASAVAGYNRAQGEIRERAERVPSKWFGEAKKRQDFEGEVIVKRTFDGDYGLRSMILMKTAKGELATWWTGWSELDEGDLVKGKVTVKGHETYKDEERTVVTRCALEITGKAEEAAS